MLPKRPIRLIATDMDGTLLTNDPWIPPENAQVLRRAAESGVALALASGRLPDDAAFFAVNAHLPMHVLALNGAATALEPLGEISDVHHLHPDSVARAIAILNQSGVQYAVFGVHEVVASDDMSYERAQIVIGTFLNHGRTAFRNCRQGMERALHDCVKLVALSENLPLLDQIRQTVLASCPDCDVTSSWWDNIEIVPRSASKGLALTNLANRLNIPMAQVMAIGDSDNDLSMLEVAGVSVAMGNARERVKAAAQFHTLTEREYGFAAAVRALVFGEDVPGVVAVR